MSQTAFTQSQFDSIYPEGIEKHYWNLARNRIIYRWLLGHGGVRGQILEIGCGKGIVVKYLRDRGVNCFGVENAPILPLSSVSIFIKTGIDHAVMDAEFRRSIDTVLLFDVIEHISDEVDFIRSIQSSFPNLKRIIMTVPARMELWSNFDEFNGHYRRYSLSPLKQIANDLSVSSVDFSYLFHSLYFPARLLLLWAKKRNTRIPAPHGLNVLIHNFFSKYFFMDYLLIPSKIKGTSIICYFELS